MEYEKMLEITSKVYNTTNNFGDIYEVISIDDNVESNFRKEIMFECVTKLKEFNSLYEILQRKVIFEGYLFKNKLNRYEVEGYDYYYTSGDVIYFFDNDGDICYSRIEHKNGDYYIVGYDDLKLCGLKVQIRK